MPPKSTRKVASDPQPPDATSNVKVKKVRAPEIKWAQYNQWTWDLLHYLEDNPDFRIKLFSDSTKDAKAERRPKRTAKDGKAQQYAVLAQHVFANDPVEGEGYAKDPARYATSVGSRLTR